MRYSDNERAIALYFHLPFCVKKCPYCDFNSHGVGAEIGESRENNYVSALLRELECRAANNNLAQRPVSSIFFGGGTPSLFSANSFAQILNTVSQSFTYRPMDNAVEVTLEANPGTLQEELAIEKLSTIHESGVNRISFGAQSFSATKLKQLGRLHSPEDIRRAVGFAKQAGFESISIDLMFGLKGESLAVWREDIKQALALDVEHLSCYGLTIEPQTEFYSREKRGEILTATEEDQALMYQLTQEMLAEHGYQQYEISNYARAGATCRHNLHYWRRADYLGLGAGAHSFFNRAWGLRNWNIKSPEGYQAQVMTSGEAIAGSEELSEAECRTEHVFLGLRTIDGIKLQAYQDRFKTDFLQEYEQQLASLLKQGLISMDKDRICLTKQGYKYANSVMLTLT